MELPAIDREEAEEVPAAGPLVEQRSRRTGRVAGA